MIQSFGIDPVASFSMDMEKEVSKTLTCSHGRGGAGVLTITKADGFQSRNQILCKDVSQTLIVNGGGDNVAKVLIKYKKKNGQ